MSYRTTSHSKSVKRRTGGLLLVVIGLVALCSPLACAETTDCGRTFVYEGQGAGRVVFEGSVHMSAKLTCADCHETKGLSGALFKMEKGANDISMRKMELGRSCGYCHPVSMKDTLQCDICHRK